LGLLHLSCRRTVKQKFHISRKRKNFRFRICFDEKRSSISVFTSPKNFHFHSVDFCFRFHIFFFFSTKKSESFCSTFIHSVDVGTFGQRPRSSTVCRQYTHYFYQYLSPFVRTSLSSFRAGSALLWRTYEPVGALAREPDQ
jgi:hypothetical protein